MDHAAFAVEGAILVWTGFRSMTGHLRAGGYFLLALAAARLLIFLCQPAISVQRAIRRYPS